MSLAAVSGAAAAPEAPYCPTYQQAFSRADADDWSAAHALATSCEDPLVEDVVMWLDITRSNSTVPFEVVSTFIVAHPEWPEQLLLRQRAEEALPNTYPPEVTIAWFERRRPVTADGRAKLGRALRAVGRETEGRALLREAWVTGSYSDAQEQAFIVASGDVLTDEDQVRRLDRLLWDGKTTEARRQMARVDDATRTVAQARLAFRGGDGGAERLYAQVDDLRRDDPGLTFDRVRYLRRADRNSEAWQILASREDEPANAERWWDERSILARRALAAGAYEEAYFTVAGHGLTGGSSLVDAEWLAGWIALRNLDRSDVALGHFLALSDNVTYPVSRARAGYWAGRAADQAGRPQLAQQWYRAAARHWMTYYGQLAAERLDAHQRAGVSPDPLPSAEEVAAFNRNELVRAVRLLVGAGETSRAQPFMSRLVDQDPSPARQFLVADLARSTGRPDLGITVAKRASRSGRPLVQAAYPSVANDLGVSTPTADPAMVNAVIRQESAFRLDAVSGSGARGLMQLMPGTASDVARWLGIGYSRERLTSDGDYNVSLGTTYLEKLVSRFDGSMPLALAGYNAGPGRVKQWLAAYGDPRLGEIDMVDWVESIPFDETRNYVQRTMENVQVYRVIEPLRLTAKAGRAGGE